MFYKHLVLFLGLLTLSACDSKIELNVPLSPANNSEGNTGVQTTTQSHISFQIDGTTYTYTKGWSDTGVSPLLTDNASGLEDNGSCGTPIKYQLNAYENASSNYHPWDDNGASNFVHLSINDKTSSTISATGWSSYIKVTLNGVTYSSHEAGGSLDVTVQSYPTVFGERARGAFTATAITTDGLTTKTITGSFSIDIVDSISMCM